MTKEYIENFLAGPDSE